MLIIKTNGIIAEYQYRALKKYKASSALRRHLISVSCAEKLKVDHPQEDLFLLFGRKLNA